MTSSDALVDVLRIHGVSSKRLYHALVRRVKWLRAGAEVLHHMMKRDASRLALIDEVMFTARTFRLTA